MDRNWRNGSVFVLRYLFRYYFREIQMLKHARARRPAYSCAMCDFCLHINPEKLMSLFFKRIFRSWFAFIILLFGLGNYIFQENILREDGIPNFTSTCHKCILNVHTEQLKTKPFLNIISDARSERYNIQRRSRAISVASIHMWHVWLVVERKPWR